MANPLYWDKVGGCTPVELEADWGHEILMQKQRHETVVNHLLQKLCQLSFTIITGWIMGLDSLRPSCHIPFSQAFLAL